MEAHQGHYNGYKAVDFELLLQVLSRIKGKFLLSNYPSDLLGKYIIQNHWYSNEYTKSIRISARQAKTKKKIEVLTANYKI
jgi:DNA adenine methylase